MSERRKVVPVLSIPANAQTAEKFRQWSERLGKLADTLQRSGSTVRADSIRLSDIFLDEITVDFAYVEEGVHPARWQRLTEQEAQEEYTNNPQLREMLRQAFEAPTVERRNPEDHE